MQRHSEYDEEQQIRLTPRQSAAAGLGAVALLGGAIGLGTYLNSKAEEAQQQLLKALSENPLSGQIAYVDDNLIKVVDASTIHQGPIQPRSFQVQGSPTNLVWINDSQLAFSTNSQVLPDNLTSFKSEVEKSDNFPSTMSVSDQVWVLNLTTGKLVSIFDAYALTESGQKLLGDVVAADIAAHQKLLESFSDKDKKSGRSLKIYQGSSATADVKDLAVSPNSREIFMLINNDWLMVDMQGNISRTVELPRGLISEQLTHTERLGFSVKFGWLESVRVTDGVAKGIDIGPSASDAACYIPQPPQR